MHLLSAGAVTSLGMMLITSGLFTNIDNVQIVIIVTIVQWQQLGLTLAKLGIDQTAFIVSIEDSKKKIDVFYYCRKYSIIISLIFSLILYLVFDYKAWIIVFVTVLLDTFSTIKSSDLNGKKEFAKTNISSLLKTPLFIVLLVIVSSLHLLNDRIIVVFFLIVCVLRFTYLYSIDRKDNCIKVRESSQILLGIQQILNFLLFRISQYLILLPFFLSNLTDSSFLNKFLFLTRYPEILSGVLVSIAPLYLPYILKNKISLKRYFFSFIFCLVICVIGAYIYKTFWRLDSVISFSELFPFILYSALIIYVNTISFLFLQKRFYKLLIKILFYALITAIFISLLLYIAQIQVKWVLYYIVPLQLILFLLYSKLYINQVR